MSAVGTKVYADARTKRVPVEYLKVVLDKGDVVEIRAMKYGDGGFFGKWVWDGSKLVSTGDVHSRGKVGLAWGKCYPGYKITSVEVVASGRRSNGPGLTNARPNRSGRKSMRGKSEAKRKKARYERSVERRVKAWETTKSFDRQGRPDVPAHRKALRRASKKRDRKARTTVGTRRKEKNPSFRMSRDALHGRRVGKRMKLPRRAKATKHDRNDQLSYKWYVVIDGRIYAANEYKEDASDVASECRQDGWKPKVVSRSKAIAMGLDPKRDSSWVTQAQMASWARKNPRSAVRRRPKRRVVRSHTGRKGVLLGGRRLPSIATHRAQRQSEHAVGRAYYKGARGKLEGKIRWNPKRKPSDMTDAEYYEARERASIAQDKAADKMWVAKDRVKALIAEINTYPVGQHPAALQTKIDAARTRAYNAEKAWARAATARGKFKV